MKRKLTILLSSVLAGALLVGGSFASYFAVTDNADSDGRLVTPGNLDGDDTTYVTIEWGTKALQNVEGIEVGKNYKLGKVGLVSSAEAGYEGIFSVSMIDKTIRTAAESDNEKLINHLTITVYEGDVNLDSEGKLPANPLTPTSDEDNTKQYAAIGAPDEHLYSVFVTYNEDALIYRNEMQNDKVYVEVNWDPKGTDVANSRQVYFYNAQGWEHVYAYYWVGNTNNDWPGVEMDETEYEDIYYTTVPMNMTGIIFDGGNDSMKTGNIDFSGYSAATGKIVYQNNGWTELPEVEEEVQYDTYKLILGDWANDNAVIFAHTWGVKDRDYKVEDQTELKIPKDAEHFMLVRMAENSEAIDYANAWNKSEDLDPTADKILAFQGYKDNKSVFAWVDLETQYDLYVKGTQTEEEWAKDEAYQFTYSAKEGYVAEIENVSLAKDIEFKISNGDWSKSYNPFGYQDTEWHEVENQITGTGLAKIETLDGGNMKVTEAASFNIYLKYDGTFVMNVAA